MKEWWVVGGKFRTTEFEEYAEGGGPERFGPFESYDEARKAWFGQSMARIDECLVRYRIVEDDAGATGKVSSAKAA
jgi:hypothetical protein